MLWANVKVEYATILIDNKLASGECLFHIFSLKFKGDGLKTWVRPDRRQRTLV
jgi:hypothetical protein